MAEVIQFPREKIVRIAPARQPDVRVTFARHVATDEQIAWARFVEHAFGSDVELIDRWAAAKSYLHGSYDVPSDTEML